MKLLSTLLFLIPVIALAHKPEFLDCPPAKSNAEAIIEKVQGIGCESDTVAISNLVNSEYEKFYGKEPQVKHKVKNILLSGSKKELELANQMLGTKSPQAWKEAVKDCTTLLCAFGKLFGSEEAAKQALNIHAKTGYIVSVDQAINQNLGEHVWTPKEILEIDAALSKIPKTLQRLSRLKKIYRQADGIKLKNHDSRTAAYAENGDDTTVGKIVIYSNGMNALSTNKNPYHSSAFTQEALIHEICHHHDFQKLYATKGMVGHSEDKKNGWLKISGWKKTYDRKGQEQWNHDNNAVFTRDYASTDPGEDYAETCMNYVLHADRLKKLSTDKYTFMKDNIFKGEEFRDKTWNEEREYNWPEMDKFAEDESFCEEALRPCLDKIYVKSDKICIPSNIETRDDKTITTGYCGQGSYSLRMSLCLNELKEKKILEANQKFSGDPHYCESGGPSFILTKFEKLCSHATDKLGAILDKIESLEFSHQVEVCERNKDYTVDCVYQGALVSVSPPKSMEKGITKFISDKIPDRSESFLKHIENIPTSTLLLNCFKGISSINEGIRTTQDGNKIPIVLYHPIVKEKYSYSMLWENTNPALEACAYSTIRAFKEKGFKVPEDGNFTPLLNTSFHEELSIFENEVIFAYSEAAQPCAFDFCRADILRKLLKKWEEKEPVKRKGFSNKEVVDELFPKIKDF